MRIPFLMPWPEIAELDDIKVLLRESPLSPVMRRRLLKGRYETAERELVKRLIRPGDHILEIGASIGILTSFLSKAAGSTGRVVSVEPDSSLKTFFEKQTAANGLKTELVNALCCPIWNHSVPKEIAALQFAKSENNLSGKASENIGTETGKNWRTAESICSEVELKPSVIIVDIEGTESVWANHSPNFPASVRLVITEFHPRLTGSAIAGRAVQSILNENFIIAGMNETVLAFERKQG